MLAALIVFGLLFAGGVIAIGALHWRGILRFGRRKSAWGIGTIVLGLAQVVVWTIFPGGPEPVWVRILIAAVGAVVIGFGLIWRQGVTGAARPR